MMSKLPHREQRDPDVGVDERRRPGGVEEAVEVEVPRHVRVTGEQLRPGLRGQRVAVQILRNQSPRQQSQHSHSTVTDPDNRGVIKAQVKRRESGIASSNHNDVNSVRGVQAQAPISHSTDPAQPQHTHPAHRTPSHRSASTMTAQSQHSHSPFTDPDPAQSQHSHSTVTAH